MDKSANPLVVITLEIVSKSHAENLVPYLESHLMKRGLMAEHMARQQFNILIRIAEICQVNEFTILNQ